jgi:gluconolactonase
MSDLNHNSKVGKISMKDVEAALAKNESNINVPVTELDLPDTIQMTNGGTGPFKGNLILITSGRGPRPPSIALVNPVSPHNVTVLLDNYFGRQFNSLNDIKVHPSGNLFFTDVTYGFLNHFRPAPLMPNQVYRFNPDTGAVKVVATDFDKCNGIAFTKDGKTAYIADTGATAGFLGNNQTEPATIYAFDVDPRTQAFTNRRVFAYADTGVPDGVQVDQNGNVYAGCGDGVNVWNDEGTLIGKFFIGTTSANMIFAGDGRLVIMAETKIFVAKIAAKEVPPLFP